MSEHVYHRFSRDDLFHTTVTAQSLVIVESGSSGWSGNMNGPSGSLSLYGGVRSRSDVNSGSVVGVQLYPIDLVDSQSIDHVISHLGAYPATGSINIVSCTSSTAPSPSSVTDTQWYDEHFSIVNRLFDWYRDHFKMTYGTGSSQLNSFRLIHIPSMFYGRSIATGSVLITDRSYDNVSGTLTYVDDGLGTLIVSGSDVTSKVGNVFYDEGLIVFTDQLHNFGSGANWSGMNPLVHIEFHGNTLMKSLVFMCRLSPGDANASSNPTYSQKNALGRRVVKAPQKNVTYVSGIGIYNEERELVAVVKLAQPIRKRETDDETIRIRLDI